MVTPRACVVSHPSASTSRDSLRVGGVMTAVTLFVLTFLWRLLTFSGFQNDHFVHLARAQQLLFGEWPIRDFVDPGLPLMYAASAAAWLAFGGSPLTELVLVSTAFAVGAVLTFVIAHRLSGSVATAGAVTVLEILIYPRTYSYPKVLLYPLAAAAILAVVDSPSKTRLHLLAGSIAVAFLFRHDHGVYIAVAAAVAIALGSGGLGWRVATRRLATVAAGVIILLLPWMAFVSVHQGLFQYFESGIQFSKAEARSTGFRSLPRFGLSPAEGLIRIRAPSRPEARIEWASGVTDTVRQQAERQYRLEQGVGSGTAWSYTVEGPSPAMLRALADDPRVAASAGLGRIEEWSALDELWARMSPSRVEVGPGVHVRENSYTWLFYLFYSLPLACLAVVWRHGVRGGPFPSGDKAAITSLCVMTLVANAGLIRGNLTVWLPDAIALAALLTAWLMSVCWNAPSAPGRVRVAARLACVGVFSLSVVATGAVGDVSEKIDRIDLRLGVDGITTRVHELATRLTRRHRDAGFPPSSVSHGLLPFFGYLDRCTEQDDRLLMTWLFPDVFVMAERGFGGGHLAFIEPFYTSRLEQERTVQRLRRESVPLVLVFLDREENFRTHFDVVSAHVASHYEVMTEVPVAGTKGVRVLKEKARSVSGIDDETRWPCFAPRSDASRQVSAGSRSA